MSVTITRQGAGFKMTFRAPRSTFTAQAQNTDETAWALAHYYGDSETMSHGYGHDATCPLCRLITAKK